MPQNQQEHTGGRVAAVNAHVPDAGAAAGDEDLMVSSMQAAATPRANAGSRFFPSIPNSHPSSSPNAPNSAKWAHFRSRPSPPEGTASPGVNTPSSSAFSVPLICPETSAGSRELPQIKTRLQSRSTVHSVMRRFVRFTPEPPRCSSRIFTPSRIRMTPPAKLGLFSYRLPNTLPIFTPRADSRQVQMPINAAASQMFTLPTMARKCRRPARLWKSPRP